MPCGTYMMQRTIDALIGVGYFSSGMLVPPKSIGFLRFVAAPWSARVLVGWVCCVMNSCVRVTAVAAVRVGVQLWVVLNRAAPEGCTGWGSVAGSIEGLSGCPQQYLLLLLRLSPTRRRERARQSVQPSSSVRTSVFGGRGEAWG